MPRTTLRRRSTKPPPRGGGRPRTPGKRGRPPEGAKKAGGKAAAMSGTIVARRDDDADSVSSELTCEASFPARRLTFEGRPRFETMSELKRGIAAAERVFAHFGRNADKEKRAREGGEGEEAKAEESKEDGPKAEDDECLLSVTDEQYPLALPKDEEERNASREAGWVPPLDVIASKFEYPHLFREYKSLSSRFGEFVESEKAEHPWLLERYPARDGLYTRMWDANFAMRLPPYDHLDDAADAAYPADGTVHRFSALMWNMFRACQNESEAGNARCMANVLAAAIDDVDGMRDDHDRLEHLIGINLAILKHGLQPTLDRSEPDAIKNTFGELAKAWKKLLDPEYDRARCDASEELWEFAEGTCWILREGPLAQAKKKRDAHDAPKFNFNYRRIPRPKRSKEGQRKRKEEDAAKAKAKKRRKRTPADEFADRVNAVEGAELADPVFDSCEAVKGKILRFLSRDGATKASFCRTLGGINGNSLNRFLQGTGQSQKGNVTYAKAYCFFERLRIMEGEPKSPGRAKREATMPEGYDNKAEPGGRPSSFVVARWW